MCRLWTNIYKGIYKDSYYTYCTKNKTSTNIRDHWKSTQYHSKFVHQIKTHFKLHISCPMSPESVGVGMLKYLQYKPYLLLFRGQHSVLFLHVKQQVNQRK